MAGAPDVVAGVVEWRGRAIALVDVERLLGGSPRAERRPLRVAVVEHARGAFAIGAEAVREVQPVSMTSVDSNGVARGAIELWGIQMLVLDPEAVASAVMQAGST